MAQGIAFVISAPSGAGKSTLIRELRRRVQGLGFSVSHTSRPPRPGEVDGEDYHFVDRERFREMIAAGMFAEHAEVHGNLYGTSFGGVRDRLAEGQDLVLDIDVQGALQIVGAIREAVLIFVIPPCWGELRRRLETRGADAPEIIARRLENARAELTAAGNYHYVVVNEDLESAVRELGCIVTAERCRTARRWEAVRILEGSD